MSIKILSLLKVIQNTVMVATVTLAMTFFASAVSAQPIGQTTDFNHMSTGFPLTGVHTNVECETCHVGGIFKGTPKDCAGCHSAGRRVVAPGKHATHIITNAPCESCHTNSVTFLGARFDHMGVQPKACTTCHAGVTAPGKPGGHVSTNAACDTCHRTTAWIPASYDHAAVLPGSCSTCHGVTATGKPGGHVVTALPCDDCNLKTSWIPAGYKHIGVIPGSCATCHNGTTATGKGPLHVVTTASCDSCHYTTSWIYNHLGVTPNTCANCHGVTATGKPANHIPTSIQCDFCHLNYTSWVRPPEVMNHSANNNTTVCKTCHDTTSPYLGDMTKKTLGSHEDSSPSQDCISCHALSFTVWNEP